MNEARGTTVIELGASASGKPSVFVMRVELGPHPLFKSRPSKKPGPKPADLATADAEWREQFHMEPAIAAVVELSADGKDIGLVGYANGTMWFEDAGIARMSLAAFATAVSSRSR